MATLEELTDRIRRAAGGAPAADPCLAVDAFGLEQMAEQKPCRSCADDGNLGVHDPVSRFARAGACHVSSFDRGKDWREGRDRTNGWYFRDMAEAIPRYALYGEGQALVPGGFAHIETIAERSALHDQ